MVVYNFKRIIKKCPVNCHELLEAKIEKFIDGYKSGVNGHCTINHSIPNHIIWVTLYDKGIHENWRNGEIVKTPLNKKTSARFPVIQKKFTGKLPLAKDLEKMNL